MIRAVARLITAAYYGHQYRTWCCPVDGIARKHTEDLEHSALYGVRRCQTCRRPIARG